MGMVIHNGSGRGDARPSDAGAKNGAPRFALLLALLAAAGIVAGFLVARGRAARPDDPADPAPAPRVEPHPQAPLAEPVHAAAPSSAGTPPAAPAATEAKVADARPDSRPVPVPPADSADEEDAEDDEAVAEKPKPAFATATEQLIAMVESIPPGIPVPPLPLTADDDLEEDADRAAEHVIEITEEDSERAAAHKENVGWTKLDLADARKEGWTAAEYIKAIEAERNEDAAFTRAKHEEFEALLADASISDEECLAELEKINAELAERGLPQILPEYESQESEAE